MCQLEQPGKVGRGPARDFPGSLAIGHDLHDMLGLQQTLRDAFRDTFHRGVFSHGLDFLQGYLWRLLSLKPMQLECISNGRDNTIFCIDAGLWRRCWR